MDINEWGQVELSRKLIDVKKQVIIPNTKKEKRMLHIVYIMVWTKVCGGSKIILEHANRLTKLNQKVTIVTFDEKPQWFKLDDEVNFIQVPKGEDIKKYIPECDLIVATSWRCIYESVKSNIAPVVFFEQGGAHLFETQEMEQTKFEIIKHRINLVPFVFTVSSYARDKILELYGKDAEVIYNSVDSNIFFPRVQKEKKNNNIELTIIGSEDFYFKNINGVLEAYRVLAKKYKNLNLNWITQTHPTKNPEKAIVNPPQNEIGEILRQTDIYICNSEYESFGLPTLEAMTCGAAIITTDTGGMRDFIVENENGLIVKKHDIDDLIKKVEILINDKVLRERLVTKGNEIAQKMTWDESIKKLLEYYQEIAKFRLK